jgi:AraC family transcriptional activator of tynA and feaB
VEQQLRFTTVKPAQRIQASAPMAGLAQRLILGSTEQGLSHTESEATLDAVISLLRPAMGASELDDSPQVRTFRKALRVIDEHIGDEALCPEWLATQVGVSVRGLYRLFSRHGLVGGAIREKPSPRPLRRTTAPCPGRGQAVCTGL